MVGLRYGHRSAMMIIIELDRIQILLLVRQGTTYSKGLTQQDMAMTACSYSAPLDPLVSTLGYIEIDCITGAIRIVQMKFPSLG